MKNFMPLRTMLRQGIPLAFGCDVPAAMTHEPTWALIGAVTRKTKSGYVAGEAERLSGPEALRIHTMGSAFAAFEEKRKGSIEEGKLADLVVWSHDLYTMKPIQAREVKPLMTLVGGKVVYSAKE
jgi:predicted amidohydrolase YtcJ